MPAPLYTVVLRVGEHLCDQAVSSPNGEYSLVHQHDGNVVIYRNADGHPVWATGTNFQGAVDDPGNPGQRTGLLELRRNGSLAVQDSDGIYLWQSPAQADPTSLALVVTDRGQALLVDESGGDVWSSPQPPEVWRTWNSVSDGRRLRRGQTLRGQTLTSSNGRFTLVWDQGGTVYLRQRDVGVLWVRRLQPGAGLVMDDEGSLDVRLPNGMLRSWIFPAGGQRVHECYISDEGRMTLADEFGTVLWAGVTPEGIGREAGRPASDRRSRLSARPPIDLAGRGEFTPLVVRTDFDHPDAWAQIVTELHLPIAGLDDLDPVSPLLIDDPTWAGAHYEEIVTALPENAPEAVLVADAKAMRTPTAAGHALLAVHTDRLLNPEEFAEDFEDDVPETIRLGTKQAVSMTVNLALANSDFPDWVHRAIR